MLFLSPIVVLIAFAGSLLATSIPRNVVSSNSSLFARDINPQYVEVGPLASQANMQNLVTLDASADFTELAPTIVSLIILLASNGVTNGIFYDDELYLYGENYVECGLAFVTTQDQEDSFQAFINEVNEEISNSGVSTTAYTLANEIADAMIWNNPVGLCFLPWNSAGWAGAGVVALTNGLVDLSAIASTC